MVTLSKLRLNAANNFKMCHVVVIILKRVVASFPHQIQLEYSGGDRYVYIEGISLEHFSSLPQT